MVAFILRSLLFFGALFGSSLACRNMKVIDDLNLERLGGTWWVWDYSGMATYTEPHSCHVSQFYPMPGGKSIKTTNDYIIYWNGTPRHVRTSWIIEDKDPAPDGNLVAKMKLNQMGEKEVPFLVLDTDYDRFLVVHMCKDAQAFFSRMESSLTLLRNMTFTQAELKDIELKVDDALKKSGVDRQDLQLSHSDWYTKDCVLPKFPIAMTSGTSTVIDTETLTATINGLAAHAAHAVEDANSLADKVAVLEVNPLKKERKLGARAAKALTSTEQKTELVNSLKAHADDVKALAADIKAISGL